LDIFVADYGIGTDGDDVLIGTTGDNLLDGGTGADTIYSRSGSDTIVLRLGDGGNTLATADTVVDFTDGSDKLGLDNNLQYSDLTISQGTGSNSGDTIISKGSEYLAILTGINASVLSEVDFTPVDIA
jgi:Ca2+-binding RTX toxin-like protein